MAQVGELSGELAEHLIYVGNSPFFANEEYVNRNVETVFMIKFEGDAASADKHSIYALKEG